jgi:hypothetical protein
MLHIKSKEPELTLPSGQTIDLSAFTEPSMGYYSVKIPKLFPDDELTLVINSTDDLDLDEIRILQQGFAKLTSTSAAASEKLKPSPLLLKNIIKFLYPKYKVKYSSTRAIRFLFKRRLIRMPNGRTRTAVVRLRAPVEKKPKKEKVFKAEEFNPALYNVSVTVKSKKYTLDKLGQMALAYYQKIDEDFLKVWPELQKKANKAISGVGPVGSVLLTALYASAVKSKDPAFTNKFLKSTVTRRRRFGPSRPDTPSSILAPYLKKGEFQSRLLLHAISHIAREPFAEGSVTLDPAIKALLKSKGYSCVALTKVKEGKAPKEELSLNLNALPHKFSDLVKVLGLTPMARRVTSVANKHYTRECLSTKPRIPKRKLQIKEALKTKVTLAKIQKEVTDLNTLASKKNTLSLSLLTGAEPLIFLLVGLYYSKLKDKSVVTLDDKKSHSLAKLINLYSKQASKKSVKSISALLSTDLTSSHIKAVMKAQLAKMTDKNIAKVIEQNPALSSLGMAAKADSALWDLALKKLDGNTHKILVLLKKNDLSEFFNYVLSNKKKTALLMEKLSENIDLFNLLGKYLSSHVAEDVLYELKDKFPFPVGSKEQLTKNLKYNNVDLERYLDVTQAKDIDAFKKQAKKRMEAITKKQFLSLKAAKDLPDLKPFCTGYHRIHPVVTKAYSTNSKPPENGYSRVYRDIFHGTDKGSFNMISVFGFSTKKVKVGRSLGDGVYFAPNPDKSAQYLKASGFSRQAATGVILHCDFYVPAGTSPRETSRFRTHELAVAPKQIPYLHIKHVYVVKVENNPTGFRFKGNANFKVESKSKSSKKGEEKT